MRVPEQGFGSPGSRVLHRRTKGDAGSWAPQRALMVAARFSLPTAQPKLGVLQMSLHPLCNPVLLPGRVQGS